MEQAAGARYTTCKYAGVIRPGCPAAIRYADDFVVLCHTRQEALEVKARLARWLAPRGLAFNEDKTRVVNLSEGFDFLGFNVRRYGTTPLIKPSKAAVRRIRRRLRTELRSLRGSNAQAVIRKLNPIIRGWAAYYRTQVSAEIFGELDHYLWQLTYKWARFSHQNKSTSWVVARHFGKFNKTRNDKWVFGDRTSGAYMHRFAWTNIVRHTIVKHEASPDDPTLADYWAQRRRKGTLPINPLALRLHRAQDGRCAICQSTLAPVEDQPQTPSEWEAWLAGSRKTIDVMWDRATSGEAEPRLIHLRCHPGSEPAQPADRHQGLLEPDAVKAARPGS
jgi:RNA-directed DNA polymerase